MSTHSRKWLSNINNQFLKSKTGNLVKNRKLNFVIKFVLLLILFYTIWPRAFFQDIVNSWNILQVKVTSSILSAFGLDVMVQGSKISIGSGIINVSRGCDAIEPFYYFASGLIAYKQWNHRKLLYILIGAVLFAIINIVRILSLCFAVGGDKAFFDFLHLEFWQVLFILFSLSLWAFFASKVRS